MNRRGDYGGNKMILEFRCSNFRSIKNEICFSSIASSDNSYENRLINYLKYRVLRTAVIYGANGSGKSNIIKAIDFMKALVCESHKHEPGQLIYQPVHKLATTEPTVFRMQFVRKNIRYAYGFSLIDNNVMDEYLYYFPNGKQVRIFERNGLKIIPGNQFKSFFGLALDALKDNRLFLSCAANFSKVSEIEEVFQFFRDDIVIYSSYNPAQPDIWRNYSIDKLQKDESVKSVFLGILHDLNTGIVNISAKHERVKIETDNAPKDFPEELKLFFARQEVDRCEAKINYGLFETDLVGEESAGINKLFEILCPIIDIVKSGKVLFCDELEYGLHEAIVVKILNMFNALSTDNQAQLFFSTHDTSLLDKDLFRRDQVWFTELDEERATKLYSLSEIKNVRKTENIEKGYLAGKYGAIPVINQGISKFFDEE